MSFRRVLVAVDLLGSSASPVIERALEMVPSSQVIQLVHVIENPLPTALQGVTTAVDQLGEMHAWTRNALQALCDEHNIPEYSVEQGHPASVIHRVAESISADLVIVGSHGRHGWRLLLGSTATGVLHGTSCNVCAVLTDANREQQSAGNYSRILAAINDSDDANAVVDEAVRLANLQRARLSLVSVVRGQPMWNTGFGEEGFERTNADLLDQAYDRAREAVFAIAESHGLPREDCYLRVGDPVHEIHELAGSLESQLVVLGTHGMQGLHVILGSTANGVIRGQSCDVLAVRLKEGSGLLPRPAKLVRSVTPEDLRDREHVSMH